MDNITYYKLVLMIVVFCETYDSDLINVPAQNVSYMYMREIYTQTKVKQHHIFSETLFWKLQNGICG